jgi:hypothetical protein
MSEIRDSVKSYFSRRFFENFLLAAGEDVLKSIHLNIALDRDMDEIVTDAGIEAGLKFRKSVLGGDYAA